MKYKCHIDGCKFEGAFTKLILHAIEVHKANLTDYFVNWMKSNGEEPIEICKTCGNKIELDFPYNEYKNSKETYNLNLIRKKFTRKSKFLRFFYNGFCSASCSHKKI